jgi:hypothetical protein
VPLRKDTVAEESLLPDVPLRVPFDFNGALMRSKAGSNPNSAHKLALARAAINAKAHMPLIHLAQDGDGMAEEEYDEEEEPPLMSLENARLSTITEKTEQRTIDSRMWGRSQQALSATGGSRHDLSLNNLRSQQYLTTGAPRVSRAMSAVTSTTDYGQLIGW